MTPTEFVAKWDPVKLAERAASQEHFIDLCRLLVQPTPVEHDKTGEEYTFEKGVAVTGPASKTAKGHHGFADVWWRGKFGWEYKTKDKHKDLAEAYRQLCQYREALENPPLLIVCDISRIEIHTNFTGTAKQVHTVKLEDIATPPGLTLLRRVFEDPQSFRPGVTTETITEEVAAKFGQLSLALRDRGHDPHKTAHFLMKCMFCLFAEDVGLLPPDLFKTLLLKWRSKPKELRKRLAELFDRMRTGGAFGIDEIPWFNGTLFDDAPPLELTEPEAGVLVLAANLDWASVEPAIFGTLFERSLDPTKRAQIGAHYTSRDDIMLVVEPVVMAPLRQEWEECRNEIEKQLDRRRKATTKATRDKADKAVSKALDKIVSRIASVRILDPACGSGNFLYVAIQQLLELEKAIITYAAQAEIGIGLFPNVRPTQLCGVETNLYATELAQVVIWIGYLQWMRDHGFKEPRNPVLEPLRNIEERDAILDPSNGKPKAASWPEAEFIIGNPPFLGSKLFRKQGLDEAYIQAMYDAYNLPNTSDLCCYWLELARRAIERKPGTRAGLLATQGIRGGANREVLERIQKSGGIFMAWSDRKWVLEGAAVHVSIVGFDDGSESTRTLDGVSCPEIHSDLTSGVDVTAANPLAENDSIGFMGDTKGGKFELEWKEALDLLRKPNPTGRPNSEVIRPWANGGDVTRRTRGNWIIDFGVDMPEAEAAGFEAPFETVKKRVYPIRKENRREAYAKRWWLHVEPRPAMRKTLPRARFIATPNLTKHRLFVFMNGAVLPDHQLIAFARSDDYFFGVLHGSVHELWARRKGTQLREEESGCRYTPTTCFKTFPMPWAPASEEEKSAPYRRIADKAKELDEKRSRWLNPREWIKPIGSFIDGSVNLSGVAVKTRSLVRESAIMAHAATDKRVKGQTLTKLYNDRPTWLKLAHEELDRAVLAAYASTDPSGGWSEDWAEVWVDAGAGQPLPDGHKLIAQRAKVEKQVLANLLRLNESRS